MIGIVIAAAVASASPPASTDGRERSIPPVQIDIGGAHFPVQIEHPGPWVTDEGVELFVGETVTVRLTPKNGDALKPELVRGELGKGSQDPEPDELQLSLAKEKGRDGRLVLLVTNRYSTPVHYKLKMTVVGDELELPICSVPANGTLRVVTSPNAIAARLSDMQSVDAQRCDQGAS